jgi:hypothetical protein
VGRIERLIRPVSFGTKSRPALNGAGQSFLEEGTVAEFQGKRVTHQYTQNNVAPPEKVFPLLCPVREADWVPGWRYRLIYSESGVAECGCIFITPNEDGTEITWVVTDYDPASFRIAFVWVNPGSVAAQISISLSRRAEVLGHTSALIRYIYTGLSTAGNLDIERYDQAWFQRKMQSWEAAINHYLQTGKQIDAAGWE